MTPKGAAGGGSVFPAPVPRSSFRPRRDPPGSSSRRRLGSGPCGSRPDRRRDRRFRPPVRPDRAFPRTGSWRSRAGRPQRACACLESALLAVPRARRPTGTRSSWLIGGGSVSDLAGFAASTWMRGVDFGFAPTTVLVHGGRLRRGQERHRLRGLQEPGRVLPPAPLRARRSLASSRASPTRAGGLGPGGGGQARRDRGRRAPGPAGASDVRPSAGTPSTAMPADPALRRGGPVRSIRVKARIVAADFRESGDRRKLNLGHTIGHAVEAVTGLPHGACVAVGPGLRPRPGRPPRRLASEAARRVLDLLGRLGVPASLEEARRPRPAPACAVRATRGLPRRPSRAAAWPRTRSGPGRRCSSPCPGPPAIGGDRADRARRDRGFRTGGAVNTTGRIFRVEPVRGVPRPRRRGDLVDGVPPGIALAAEDFEADLARRQVRGRGHHGPAGAGPAGDPLRPLPAAGPRAPRCACSSGTRIPGPRTTRPWPRCRGPGTRTSSGSVRYRGFQDPRGSGHFSGRDHRGPRGRGRAWPRSSCPAPRSTTRILARRADRRRRGRRPGGRRGRATPWAPSWRSASRACRRRAR
ncbi:MAG: hypothetical protein M0C28_25555 [Candidatus Moduliflexus flocculans]|nr:hypothetical protein [Candidatus Moduliflexus flocculans]